MKWFLIILVALFPATAKSEVVAYRGVELRQVCNATSCQYVPTGITLHGSAVVIGERRGKTILLTALHNISNRLPIEKKFVIGGKWVRGKCVAHDSRADLCVIECVGTGAKCTPIAERNGNTGDAISVGGFAGGTQWRVWRGSLKREFLGRNALANTPVPQGVSGGGMIRGGKLIGIISTTGQDTHACTVGHMRSLLRRTYGTADLCSETAPVAPLPPVLPIVPTPPTDNNPPTPPIPPDDKPVDPPAPVVGKTGPEGPRGPKGDRGDIGPPGKELSADLWDKPVTVILYGPDKQEIDRQTFTLREWATGEHIFRMQFKHPKAK